MKREFWVKKVKLNRADIEDEKYYRSLSPEERLDIVQELRERWLKINNEDRKRLRKVLRII